MSESPAEEAKCQLCGHPMPSGEEMFFYHGYSGPCPGPPLIDIAKQEKKPPTGVSEAVAEAYARAADKMFNHMTARLDELEYGGHYGGRPDGSFRAMYGPSPDYEGLTQSSSRAAISPSEWRASMEGVMRLIETDSIRSADPFRGRRPVNTIVMSDDGYNLLRNHLKVTLAVPGHVEFNTMQGIPIYKTPTESTALMEALRLVYEQGRKVLLYVDSRYEFVILDPHKLAAWNIYGFTRQSVLPRSTDAVHHNSADKLQQPVDGGGGSEEHQQNHPGSEAADGDVLRGPEASERLPGSGLDRGGDG